MTDPSEALSVELVPPAAGLAEPAATSAAAAVPLLPAAERYAACQAAPRSARVRAPATPLPPAESPCPW